MKNKIIIGSVAIIILIIIGYFVVFKKSETKETYQFVQVEKGNIKTTVTCTGPIDAQLTVQVGTQVSGTIAKLYADFNSIVKKNQILAQLDTTLFDIAVSQANANLAKANSQYEVDKKNYENNVELNKDKLISDFALQQLKATMDQDYAVILTSQAALQTAKANVNYATIRSPIDGIVENRAVTEGQTVAASLSAPTLFTIAENLSNVQIEALVTEDDIGQVKDGQTATFTVQAYPDATFSGIVHDIYLQPTTVSNVVNYTVIIFAKNKNNMLMPGMTATIDILTAEKDNVFMIYNTALRYRPSDKILKEFVASFPKNNKTGNSNTSKNYRQGNNSSTQARGNSGSSNLNSSQASNNSQNSNSNIARLWYLDKDNKIKLLVVKTGLNNGQKTEISSDKISENMKFISGTTTSKSQNSSAGANQNLGGQPGGQQFRRLF